MLRPILRILSEEKRARFIDGAEKLFQHFFRVRYALSSGVITGTFVYAGFTAIPPVRPYKRVYRTIASGGILPPATR
jgi:hypothetical protein